MESERFDDLVRGAFERASRRRVVRGSLGAVAAGLLAGLGSTSIAEGKGKKKRKKGKEQQPTDTIAPAPPSPPVAAATCPADLPVTCGRGCCPSTFPKCCTERFGAQAVAVAQEFRLASRTASDTSCNPASFNCCPAELGGGSCGGRLPQCCPPTERQPFGTCTEADATCCPVSVGGGSCPVDFPRCCPGGGVKSLFISAPATSAVCCQANQDCCLVDDDCPDGQSCNGNCCQTPEIARRAPSRAAESPRAGIPAR